MAVQPFSSEKCVGIWFPYILMVWWYRQSVPRCLVCMLYPFHHLNCFLLRVLLLFSLVSPSPHVTIPICFCWFSLTSLILPWKAKSGWDVNGIDKFSPSVPSSFSIRGRQRPSRLEKRRDLFFLDNSLSPFWWWLLAHVGRSWVFQGRWLNLRNAISLSAAKT